MFKVGCRDVGVDCDYVVTGATFGSPTTYEVAICAQDHCGNESDLSEPGAVE